MAATISFQPQILILKAKVTKVNIRTPALLPLIYNGRDYRRGNDGGNKTILLAKITVKLILIDEPDRLIKCPSLPLDCIAL